MDILVITDQFDEQIFFWVPTRCRLNVGTVPTRCRLNVGTVPTRCRLNIGTVPTFKLSLLVSLMHGEKPFYIILEYYLS